MLLSKDWLILLFDDFVSVKHAGYMKNRAWCVWFNNVIALPVFSLLWRLLWILQVMSHHHLYKPKVSDDQHIFLAHFILQFTLTLHYPLVLSKRLFIFKLSQILYFCVVTKFSASYKKCPVIFGGCTDQPSRGLLTHKHVKILCNRPRTKLVKTRIKTKHIHSTYVH